MKFRNLFYSTTLSNILRNKHFKRGVPFLFLVLASSFGVKWFASLRYEFRKNETLTPENLARLGIQKKKVSLEEIYEEMKKVDNDSWENVRVPRPWEEQSASPAK